MIYIIPVDNNARIHSTIKDLCIEEARIVEKTRRFPDK